MKNKLPAFTIIEVMIAMGILSIISLSMFNFIRIFSHQTNSNKNKLTATYLAQECVELLRNVRDSAWRQNLPWDCGWAGDNFTTKKFRITPTQDLPKEDETTICRGNMGVLIEPEKTIDNSFFQLNQAQGTLNYSHKKGSNWIFTGFSRSFTVDNSYPTEESEDKKNRYDLTCHIWWDENNHQQEINITTSLTNWR
jgi:type II secretory pathway pseudopilin PulG